MKQDPEILHSTFYILHSRKRAFTLVELLIYAAIFSVVTVAFTTILLTTVQIQVQQESRAEVNQQSQFALQEVQYYVERASLVDMPQDTATTTLKLWLGVNSQDPTFIKLSSGTLYLQQTATGTLQALTSNKVTVSNLAFTRRANPPGHDSVNVSFTMAYNSPNLKQAFSEVLQTTVARVSAATFDSNVLPSSTATYSLGAAGAIWSSVNGIINFSGSNVGIGVSPVAPLEVAGGNVRVDNGDVYVYTNTNGLILKDVNSVCWRIRVATSGALSTASLVACP
jgi:type II secretory pathway pseudopilin PulG